METLLNKIMLIFFLTLHSQDRYLDAIIYGSGSAAKTKFSYLSDEQVPMVIFFICKNNIPDNCPKISLLF